MRKFIPVCSLIVFSVISCGGEQDPRALNRNIDRSKEMVIQGELEVTGAPDSGIIKIKAGTDYINIGNLQKDDKAVIAMPTREAINDVLQLTYFQNFTGTSGSASAQMLVVSMFYVFENDAAASPKGFIRQKEVSMSMADVNDSSVTEIPAVCRAVFWLYAADPVPEMKGTAYFSYLEDHYADFFSGAGSGEAAANAGFDTWLLPILNAAKTSGAFTLKDNPARLSLEWQWNENNEQRWRWIIVQASVFYEITKGTPATVAFQNTNTKFDLESAPPKVISSAIKYVYTPFQ